ncbi:MAG TPA: serine/threonine-protein kinase [Spirillospora sp.]
MDADIRPLEPADPREVGGHPLLGRLGSGGMGLVYLGADPRSGGRVAVKTIHPHLAGDPSCRRRFKDEAYLASRVASFCTARVLAHGEENGRPYLVTEYVGGVSLHSRLVAGGPLPPAELHGVAVGVASALAAIHAAGLVHRDLKPANVMLTLSGCRVIDFGIARSQDCEVAAGKPGQILGTPGWMAPEVLTGGAATPAADVFAWGCLIAHAGTGRMPIGGDPATLRTAADQPDLSGLPEPLVPVVRAALATNPAERPTAFELLLMLVGQREPHTGGPGRASSGPPADGPSPAPPARGGHENDRDDRHEDADTQAFTPPGAADAASSTRARLLTRAGAAAGTVLVGAVIVGLAQGRSEAQRTAAVSSWPAAAASRRHRLGHRRRARHGRL